LDAARSRWAQVAAQYPEIRPALPLHQALLTLQLELLESLPAPPSPAEDELERIGAALAAGTPVFRAVHVPAVLEDGVPWLSRFADALASGGAGTAATKVKAAFEGGQVDPLAFLAASWHRDSGAA
jgi:hypothetical protein